MQRALVHSCIFAFCIFAFSHPCIREASPMIPGEYLLGADPIEINAGRPTVRIEVTNRADRPVQVGSHCHFFEVNRGLTFDRELAYGMRLNIAAGTAVRFEPGDTRDVELVAIGGARRVTGLNRLVEGPLDDPGVRARALKAVRTFTADR
jgi:urease beta subunit